MLQSNPSLPPRRLSDLRRAQPGDPTLQNLLGVLTAMHELCSRLPVYEYEADNQGHTSAAAAFHQLADAERRAFDDLLAALREHLERTAPAAGSTQASA